MLSITQQEKREHDHETDAPPENNHHMPQPEPALRKYSRAHKIPEWLKGYVRGACTSLHSPEHVANMVCSEIQPIFAAFLNIVTPSQDLVHFKEAVK